MVALANFNPICFLRQVRFLLGTLALFLAAPLSAMGGPKELRTPPVGETIDASVIRGGSTRIIFKAYEGRGNPLAYQITSEPRHGELEDFRQADSNRQGFASAVYVHGDDEASQEDELSFRAKALVGGGVSSPIKVRIRIIDAPPQLQVTPGVDFSAVAGESDRQQIILANVGGGRLEGRIEPTEPFSVEGNSRFSLGRGDMTNIAVLFSPKAVDPVAPQKLSPAPADPDSTVTLRGKSSPPFQASATPLTVESGGARIGSIVVSNLSRAPVAVGLGLTMSGAADIPTRVELPEQGIIEIPVRIGPERAGGAGKLDVVLSNSFYRQDLKIEVPAVPPRLELTTPELDFRTGNEAVLAVKNSGGTEGRITLELDSAPGIKSIEGAQNFAVAPGKTREIRLRNDKKKEIPNPDFLVVRLGSAGQVPVPLLFAATQPSPSPTPAEVTPPSPGPTPRIMPWELNRDVKLEFTEGNIFFAWAQEKKGWADALLETVDGKVSTPHEAESGKSGGWWNAIRAWWTDGRKKAQEALENKKRFFNDRLAVPGEEEPGTGSRPEGETSAWGRTPVRDEEMRSEVAVWRVTARDENDGTRKPVSPDFQIDWQGRTLALAATQATEQGSGLAAPTEEDASEPAKSPSPRSSVSATRKLAGVTVIPERTWATVHLAIGEDHEISGFRLERGAMVVAEDADTGLPTPPKFVPSAHAGKITISAPAAAEYEGKKLTVVVATIDGLQPGTATFWRLVPLSGDSELMPTEEFLVPTAPPWRFPWRASILGLLTALLATVLWLRHRIRKAGYE